MKAIIRLRKEDNILPEIELALEKLNIDIVKYIHPDNLSFAEFHNFIFRDVKDEIYIIMDNDVLINKDIYAMIDYIKTHLDCVMVSCRIISNDIKIRLIMEKCFRPNFNFGCCVVRGSFLKKIKILKYLECCEDDYCKQVALDNGYKIKLFQDIFFTHLSNNWDEKLLRSLKWTIANSTLYYIKTKKVDSICQFEYNYENIKSFSDRVYNNAKVIDNEYSYKLKAAILDGYVNYKRYVKNRRSSK